MKLPQNVKVKGFPWTVVPLLSRYTAHAIYPNIYLPKHIYKDLQSSSPDPKHISILIHEQTHIERQQNMGWFLWGLRYCFSGTFRFEEEVAAIVESMKYLKKNNVTWDTQKTARFLSSYLYLWCISYEDAKKRLDREWMNI